MLLKSILTISTFLYLSISTIVDASADILPKHKTDDIINTQRTDLIKGDRQRDRQAVQPQPQVNIIAPQKKPAQQLHSPNIATPPLTANMPAEMQYLGVYVGQCPYTRDAIKSAQEFLSSHSNFSGRFYMVKTTDKYELTEADVGGVEFHLPIDSKKYDISTAPSFVFSFNGRFYKVSGLVNLSEVYEEVKKGTASGRDKGNYIYLDIKGKGCRASHIDLTPVKIDPRQIDNIEELKEPDLRGLISENRFTMPNTSAPVRITHKFEGSEYLPFSKYIVFSQMQKDWARKMINDGAFGCCTDCRNLDGLFPLVQMCSREMLEKMGVRSTPAIIQVR